MMDLQRIFTKYFWSLFGVVGVVLFWAGIWDGLGSLPYISNYWVSLIVGIAMLGSSGLFVKQFGAEDTGNKQLLLLHHVSKHPFKHQFNINYYDKIQRKHLQVNASNLAKIEHDSFLVMRDKHGETFIPIHRVKSVFHKNKEIHSVQHLKQHLKQQKNKK
ncbi:MAG TPA: hypothetical protein VJI15_06595 [Candidatus Nanoarchaeia archaeon]|nr:hypothetical protein [Candidatus Nanoarchaeia archaeon]